MVQLRRLAIVTWIERTYHRRRLTPIEFEPLHNRGLEFRPRESTEPGAVPSRVVSCHMD